MIYYFTLAFILGLIVPIQIDVLTILSWLTVFHTLVATILFAAFALLTRQRTLFPPLVCATALCFAFTLGLSAGPSAQQRTAPYYDQQHSLQGVVQTESIRQHDGYTSFLFKVTSGPLCGVNLRTSVGRDQAVFLQGERLRTRENDEQGAFLQPNNLIQIEGTLVPLQVLRNPGGFDAVTYNRVHHIGGKLEHASIIQATSDEHLLSRFTTYCGHLSARLSQTIQTQIGGDAGELLVGMTLGGANSGLDDEVRDIFSANGLSHLLSVSGTHLLLLASFLTSILYYFPIKKSLLIKGIMTLCLLFYVTLCGVRPPVMRALIMTLVVLFAGRGANRGRLLCMAVISLLVYEPLWLLDIGMQLSVGASAGLIWLVPRCEVFVENIATCLVRLFPKILLRNNCSMARIDMTQDAAKYRKGQHTSEASNNVLPDFLRTGIAITLAAQLAVLPLMIAYFHQISIISIVSNIILVPLLELSVMLTVGGLLFGGLGIACLQTSFLHMSKWLVTQVLTQADLLAGLPYSTIAIGALPDSLGLFCAFVFYVMLGIWAKLPMFDFLRPSERTRMLAWGFVFLMGSYVYLLAVPKPFTAYFLDVGQGDCTIMVTPQRQVIVYDTGGLKGLDTGSRVIVPFLRYLGLSKIDLLILSHYDYDHVGGASSLCKDVKVKQLLLPNEVTTDGNRQIVQEILSRAKQQGTQVYTAKNWLQWDFTNESRLARAIDRVTDYVKLYDVNDLTRKSRTALQNEDSVVVKVLDTPTEAMSGNEASTLVGVYTNQGSLLLTGDMGIEREEQLELTPHTVLKAGHHGSKYSSSSDFLEQVSPKYTVISCGVRNRYGHPHEETLERLQALGTKVLRTDEMGAVKLEF